MTRIWVTGEALIDFVPGVPGDAGQFRACCGGSTYNVAKAAARQGAEVSFIGPISTDLFGDTLADDLSSEGIDLTCAPRVAHPTTLAFVKYQGPEARYAFFDNDSAMRLTPQGDIAARVACGDIIHAGSISLINDPGGAGIVDTIHSTAGRALLSLDPNARPEMIQDIEGWRARINTLIHRAALVKMSNEDLNVLAPGTTAEAFIADLVHRGIALAVITLGEQGTIAATRHGQARVGVHSKSIVDTVGAGDTVTGTLLAEIARLQLTTSDALTALGDDTLGTMLDRAMAAAWLNCQATGCDPPTRQRIDAMLNS